MGFWDHSFPATTWVSRGEPVSPEKRTAKLPSTGVTHPQPTWTAPPGALSVGGFVLPSQATSVHPHPGNKPMTILKCHGPAEAGPLGYVKLCCFIPACSSLLHTRAVLCLKLDYKHFREGTRSCFELFRAKNKLKKNKISFGIHKTNNAQQHISPKQDTRHQPSLLQKN